MQSNDLSEQLCKMAECRLEGQEAIRALQTLLHRLTTAAERAAPKVSPPHCGSEMSIELLQDLTGRC